jgi:hypothetical protein
MEWCPVGRLRSLRLAKQKDSAEAPGCPRDSMSDAAIRKQSRARAGVKAFAYCCLVLFIAASGKIVLSHRDDLPKCQLALEPAERQIGEIRQVVSEFTFTIRNHGSSPVNLRDSPSTCACNSMRLDRTSLQPSESATLSVMLDGRKLQPGRIQIPIRLEYDCAGKSLQSQSTLVGLLVPHFSVNPKIIRFREHDEPRKRILCTTNYFPEMTILELSCSSPDILVSRDPDARDAILVTLKAETKQEHRSQSILHAELNVKTDSKAIPEFKVPITYIGYRNVESVDGN